MALLSWFRPVVVACTVTINFSLIAVPAAVAQANGDPGCRAVDLPNAPEAAASARESVQSIYTLLDSWRGALREADIEAVTDLVAEDAEFWSHGVTALVGRRALADAFRPFLTNYELQQEFDCYELTVRGDVAFMRGFERNRLVPRSGGEAIEVRQRAFSVMRRGIDGRWRFVRGMTNQGPDQ